MLHISVCVGAGAKQRVRDKILTSNKNLWRYSSWYNKGGEGEMLIKYRHVLLHV